MDPVTLGLILKALAGGLGSILKGTVQGINKTLGLIKDQLSKVLDNANKLEKMSLVLGKTFTDTEKSLRPVMQGLRGTIEQKLVASIAGMQQGLQGNTSGIARLINQQQLTGTSFTKTAQVLAKLETTLGLSRDSTNYLSNSLITTGETWNTSTEHLINVIDSLSKTFPAQRLAGLGEGLVEAVTQLGAELPANIANNFDAVIASIFDTSEEAYANLVRLGIGNIREELAAVAHSTELSRGLLVQAIQTAARTTEYMAGGANKFYRQVGITQENLGKASLDFTVVNRNLGTRLKVEIDQALDFGRTLENLKNEVLQPLITFFLQEIYPSILTMVDVFSFAGTEIARGLSEYLGVEIGNTAEAFRVLTLNILKFSIHTINQIEAYWNAVAPFLKPLLSLVIYIGDAIFEFLYRKFLFLAQGFNIFETALYGVLKFLVNIPFLGMSETAKYMEEKYKESAQRTLDTASLIGESYMDLVTNPFDQFGAMKEKADRALSSKVGVGTVLLGPLVKTIQEGIPFQRESNKYLDSMNKGISSIDRKTPDVTSTNNLLNENVNQVSLLIERVLGVRTTDSYEAILEELRKQREAAEQTKDATVKSAQSMSNVEANTFVANTYLANTRFQEKPA